LLTGLSKAGFAIVEIKPPCRLEMFKAAIDAAVWVGLVATTNIEPAFVRLPDRFRFDALSKMDTPTGTVMLLRCCPNCCPMDIVPPIAAPLAPIVRVCPPCKT
jgi:hypothetical protein